MDFNTAKYCFKGKIVTEGGLIDKTGRSIIFLDIKFIDEVEC